MIKKTKNVPGDIAEFGIYRGRMFVPMAKIAQKWGKVIHGIDSFEGMPEPGEHDGNHYPKGKFSNTSVSLIRNKLDGVPAEIYKGFVPGILEELLGIRYSFVHLDLDHYVPTAICMVFVWSKMCKGGILCVHDFFPDRKTLAAKACNEFIKPTGINGKIAWWRKP